VVGRRPICEYCGCRQIEPLAELMDEHLALLDLATDVEIALRDDDRPRALETMRRLADLLDRHVRREEDGVFTALKEAGPAHTDEAVLDELSDLEREHVDFRARIAALDPADPSFDTAVPALVRHLSEHIDREDLGIFPVTVVTLGAQGWDTIAAVHREQPSFLAGA
jgi:hemerythrin-like domain-containing protein